MTAASKDLLRIHVTVDISASTLQAIVANAKKTAHKNAQGEYRIDTADKVSEMISRFLAESDFESYARDIGNYQ